MADNETIADIIAEMRRGTRLPGYWRSCTVNEILQYHADRLEAAHKRELSKDVSKNGADFGQLGDAAKLRGALKQVNELNDLWFDTFTLPDGATSIHDEIEDVISAALAAPPRNCDVGSAEGQYARFVAVCHANVDLTGRCRESCPFRHVPAEYKCDRAECFARWAQLPYKEGGGR